MKLYKIYVKHFAPKDSHSSVETFLLANSDEEVYEWLDKKQFNLWSERNNEGDLLDIYDDDYNIIGKETYKEKMLRLKGDFFDTDVDISDAYYGITIFGWKEVETDNVQVTIDLLKKIDFIEFFNMETNLK